MSTKRLPSILLLLLLAIFAAACAAPPPASQTEVIREVPVTVEVTRVVEITPESEAAQEPEAEHISEPMQVVKSIELTFFNHLQVGFNEQDVFLQDPDSPDQVLRIPVEMLDDEDMLAQPIYASAEFAEHDEFNLSDAPLGPFPKGEALGVTAGEYFAASGSGVYTVQGDSASIEFSYENLFPNATYTLWCARVAIPPVATIINLACGEPDGTDNTFVTDAEGNGSIAMTLPPRRETNDDRISVFGIAYHSDGQTYGDSPGEFGRVTHTQLVAPVPPPSDEAWVMETMPVAAASQ